jgi:hypothetical protein
MSSCEHFGLSLDAGALYQFCAAAAAVASQALDAQQVSLERYHSVLMLAALDYYGWLALLVWPVAERY